MIFKEIVLSSEIFLTFILLKIPSRTDFAMYNIEVTLLETVKKAFLS